MRTIRIKLYKFNELSSDSQAIAIVNEAIRFNISFTGRSKKEFNSHELEAAKERIIKYKHEFTEDGKRY